MQLKKILALLTLLTVSICGTNSSADEDTIRWLSFLEGSWKGENKIREKGADWTVAEATWNAAFSSNKSCLVINRVNLPDETVSSIAGPTMNGDGYFEYASISNGIYYTVKADNAEGNKLECVLEVFFPTDGKGTGTYTLTKVNENQFSVEWDLKFDTGLQLEGGSTLNRVLVETKEETSTLKAPLQSMQFLIGDWTAEYTLPVDIPELGAKKGSRLVERMINVPILDGNGIEFILHQTIDRVPQPPSKEIVMWDQSDKQIKHIILRGDGSIGQGTWNRDGDDWNISWKFSTPSGVYSGVSLHRPKDEDSYIWHMTNMKLGGDALPDWPEVTYHRTTQLHEQWLKYLTGTWEVEFEDGREGTARNIRMGNTQAVSILCEMDDFSIVGVIGWHADSQKFVETDFTDQDNVKAHLHREYTTLTPERLIGNQRWWDESIGAGGQELIYHRISDDEMELVGKASQTGGEDWVVKFRRK